MPSLSSCLRHTVICTAALLLAACASQREPAQKMLDDIQAAMAAASADAATYVPDQLNEVQTKLGALQASFDQQDYKSVLAGAPSVLRDAQGLAGAAAAKKAEVMKGLNESWTAMASAVPGYFTAIQSQIEHLSNKSNRKLAKGIDLDAARSGLSDATSLWSKAQGAFGNGNMDEAVSTAQAVQSKLQALAGSLKMELPPPPAG